AAPTAEDVCDAAPIVTCSHTSGLVFPLGQTVVQCSATDASGNSSSASFTVTVRDTTPPTLSVPASVVVEQATAAGTSVAFLVSATRLCGANPSVTATPASGSVFPLGVTAVRCVATDASGNASVATFSVTVKDTTPPVLSTPQDLTVEQAAPAGTVVAFVVSA